MVSKIVTAVEDVENNGEEVKDHYHLAYILFFILGTLMKVPSFFFVTATDFWMYEFRDLSLNDSEYTNDNRTELQHQFTSQYSIVNNVSRAVFIAAVILYLHKIPYSIRINGSLIMTTVFFLIMVIFSFVNTDSFQGAFFGIVMAIGFLITAGDTIFMVSLFQIIAKFPTGYLASTLIGMSLCGIYASLVQIFAIAVATNPELSGFIYFLLAFIINLIGFIMYLVISKKSEFFKFHANRKLKDNEIMTLDTARIWRIFNDVKYLMLIILIVDGSTVMIHPGLTALVKSMDSGTDWNDRYFVPVITFLVTNIFELLGRIVVNRRPFTGPTWLMILAGIIRLGFIPIFMYCNMQTRHHLPVVFDQNWMYIIFIIVFMFTNGYMANWCIVRLPMAAHPEDITFASLMIISTLLISLAACAALNSLIIAAV